MKPEDNVSFGNKARLEKEFLEHQLKEQIAE
jgi:hypothetical protein